MTRFLQCKRVGYKTARPEAGDLRSERQLAPVGAADVSPLPSALDAFPQAVDGLQMERCSRLSCASPGILHLSP